MENIEITVAERGDAQDIEELEKLCFSDPWSLSSVISEMSLDVSLCVTAKAEGKTVGYVTARYISPECEILRVATHPSYRRCGIAKKMLAAVMDGIEERDESPVFYIEVRESNAPARALYSSLGFSEIAIRKNYYRSPAEDAVILKK